MAIFFSILPDATTTPLFGLLFVPQVPPFGLPDFASWEPTVGVEKINFLATTMGGILASDRVPQKKGL
jgi:hypothetical protein